MYVPNYTSGNCAYVYNDRFIRVYDVQPTYNSTVHYVDYLFDSHYLSREGSTTFSNYSTLPICSTDITTNFYARNDIFEIVCLFTIFVGWTWFLVSKLVKTFFHGGKRL